MDRDLKCEKVIVDSVAAGSGVRRRGWAGDAL